MKPDTHSQNKWVPSSKWSPRSSVAINFMLVSLSGFLVGLSLHSTTLSFLSWICLVPWLIASQMQSTRFCICTSSFFAGFVLLFIGCNYLFWDEAGFGKYMLFAQSCYSGICFVGVTKLLRWHPLSQGRTAGLLWSVACWLLFEWLISSPPKLLFEGGFPFLKLGSTQFDFIYISQICRLTGLLGLTIFVVVVNCGVLELWKLFRVLCASWNSRNADSAFKTSADHKSQVMRLSVYIGAASIALVYGFIRVCSHDATSSRWPVRIVATPGQIVYESQRLRLTDDRPIDQYLAEDLSDGKREGSRTTIYVWGEAALVDSRKKPITLNVDPSLGRENACVTSTIIQKTCDRFNCCILIGALRRGGASSSFGRPLARQSSFFFSPHEEIQVYDKIKLAPFAERRPMLGEFVGREMAAKLICAGPYGYRTLIPGSKPTIFRTPRRAFRFGNLICYDVFFKSTYAAYGSPSVDCIINLSNVTLVSPTGRSMFDVVANRAAQACAIICEKPVIRTTVAGDCAVISPKGEILKKKRCEDLVIN